MEFTAFPKIARLSRTCVITEKIDGTNASIYVPEDEREPILLGSRTRWITEANDNHGFAKWAMQHADELRELGPGHHFGEWWGSGIQRGYGLQKGEKRFSLFNTARWSDERDKVKYPEDRPACCHVVPILFIGLFTTENIEYTIQRLSLDGSFAAPGFGNPEGIVIWHDAARVAFKKTLLKDDEYKGKSASVA